MINIFYKAIYENANKKASVCDFQKNKYITIPLQFQ